VRLLLDAHLSHRRVAEPLRERGHDVLALQEEPDLMTSPDDFVLRIARDQGRILVTCNARHYHPLARDWADVGRSHAGIVLLWRLRTNEHEAIVESVERLLRDLPDEASWLDLVLAI
jgi:predicted nuclease of predicted toxin-antitoxin system